MTPMTVLLSMHCKLRRAMRMLAAGQPCFRLACLQNAPPSGKWQARASVGGGDHIPGHDALPALCRVQQQGAIDIQSGEVAGHGILAAICMD